MDFKVKPKHSERKYLCKQNTNDTSTALKLFPLFKSVVFYAELKNSFNIHLLAKLIFFSILFPIKTNNINSLADGERCY